MKINEYKNESYRNFLIMENFLKSKLHPVDFEFLTPELKVLKKEVLNKEIDINDSTQLEDFMFHLFMVTPSSKEHYLIRWVTGPKNKKLFSIYIWFDYLKNRFKPLKHKYC